MPMHHRPRTVPELLDATVQLLRADFATFATLAVVASLPVLAGSVLLALVAPEARAGTPTVTPSTAHALAGALVGLGGWGWLLFSSGSIPIAAESLFRGERLTSAAALRAGLRRGRTVLAANVVRMFAVTASFIVAFAVAAVAFAVAAPAAGSNWQAGAATSAVGAVAGLAGACYLLLRWYVVTPVAALERVPYAGALDRSTALTRGAIGRALLMALVFFALTAAAALTGFVVVTLTAGVAGLGVVEGLLNTLWILFYPIGTLFETMFYLDQRIRTEGYDLEMLERELGDPAPVRARDVPAGMPGQVGAGAPVEPPARRGLFS